MFHQTDFGGFLVCCYKAIQQLNGVKKFCCNLFDAKPQFDWTIKFDLIDNKKSSC